MSQPVWLIADGRVCNRTIDLFRWVIDRLGPAHNRPFDGNLRFRSNSQRYAWYSPHVCRIKGRDALLESQRLGILRHRREISE
jgi:hypothetical protein